MQGSIQNVCAYFDWGYEEVEDEKENLKVQETQEIGSLNWVSYMITFKPKTRTTMIKIHNDFYTCSLLT